LLKLDNDLFLIVELFPKLALIFLLDPHACLQLFQHEIF